MIRWHRQGAAVIGELTLLDGKPARAVLVDGRQNPRGAVLVFGRPDGSAQTEPLEICLALVPPVHIIDISCMQERVFGASQLPPPPNL